MCVNCAFCGRGGGVLCIMHVRGQEGRWAELGGKKWEGRGAVPGEGVALGDKG